MIRSERAVPVPAGFPEGPWATKDLAVRAVNAYCTGLTKQGKGHGVVKSSARVPTTKAGAKTMLRCDRNAMPKAAGGDRRETPSTGTGCGWQLWIEDAQEGWVVKDHKPHDDSCEHNHCLCGSLSDQLTKSTMRSIPEHLVVFAEMLKKAGQGPAQIDRFLKSVANDEGTPVTWTYDDVYNHFRLTAEDKFLDASRLAEWVESRNERGLPAFIHCNAVGQLERVFFVPKGAREFWAKSPKDNVAIYDTTFSTNRAGMKLGCGTGVYEEGLSNLLFVSLVCFQDAESFQWVFECFLNVFRHTPCVLFTDSDPAMELAINVILTPHGTVHLLCTWHLSKNLTTNMKPTARGKWTAFLKKWWAICKETSALSLNTFDREWDELMKARQKALKWLQGLKDKRERWAARYTWRYFTAGVHSTQRAESVHSTIKKFLSATTLLVTLADSLMKHSDDIDDRAALKAARNALTATSRSMQRDMPAVAAIANTISTHALDVLRAQQAQQIAYNLTGPFEMPGNATPFYTASLHAGEHGNRVVQVESQVSKDYGLPGASQDNIARTHVVTMTTCSCQFQTCWGLPCRHMLRLYTQAGITSMPTDVIARRWVKISAEEEVARTRELLKTVPLPRNSASSKSTASRPMNQQERYSFCNIESKAVIELASNSREGMDVFVRYLDACKEELRRLGIDHPQANTTTGHPPGPTNAQASTTVLNPPTTHKRGKPQSKRKKSSWER